MSFERNNVLQNDKTLDQSRLNNKTIVGEELKSVLKEKNIAGKGNDKMLVTSTFSFAPDVFQKAS